MIYPLRKLLLMNSLQKIVNKVELCIVKFSLPFFICFLVTCSEEMKYRQRVQPFKYFECIHCHQTENSGNVFHNFPSFL